MCKHKQHMCNIAVGDRFVCVCVCVCVWGGGGGGGYIHMLKAFYITQ